MAAFAAVHAPRPFCARKAKTSSHELSIRPNIIFLAFGSRNKIPSSVAGRSRSYGSTCSATQEAYLEMPKESDIPPVNSRVVIIGAGMAGLTAAAALSQQFDEVLLLERDSCSTDGERRGVPQFSQPHTLLTGGTKVLEKYVPGFTSECAAKGATMWDILENMVNYDFGTYVSKAPPGEQTLPVRIIGASRGFLEGILRERVLQNPNVSLRSSTVITGLTFSSDGSSVTGVVLKDGSKVLGDLVVDAAGRASKEKLAFFISNKPYDEQLSLLLPIENQGWQVILCGRHPHVPPTTEDGFMRWLQGLPSSDIFNAVSAATPISPILTYSRTDSINNHLENVEMPDGLVAVGDSVCSFNPVYGQGMTMAMKGVDLLAQAIHTRWKAADTSSPSARRQALKGFSREFQAALGAEIAFPWSIATGEDIRYLRSAGLMPPEEKSLYGEIMNWYMALAIRAGMEFWRSNLRLVQVMHMEKPPSTLFHPDISLRVLQLLARDAFARLNAREEIIANSDQVLKSS